MQRTVVYLLLSVGLILSAACRDFEPVPSSDWAERLVGVIPDVKLPVPSGPHRVGRRFQVWYDAGRDRSIPLWIYYPAWVVDSAREPVLQDSVWAVLHRSEVARMLGAGPAAGLAQLRTSARTDAPVEPVPAQFRVLLFAPARGWLPTDYSTLLEEMVSRGYVVVAFAPPGDAAVVRLPDGTVVPAGEASESSHQRTVADFSFIARTLRDRARDPGWPFAGMLDLSHVGVIGHGLGGSAAFLTVARDTAFAAAASLDGDFLRAAARDLPVQPLFYLSTQPAGLDAAPIDSWGDLDRSERRHTEMWNALRAEARWSRRAQVIGMEGGNFLDAALIAQAATRARATRLAFGSIDGSRGIALAAGLLDTFFSAAFGGSAANFANAVTNFPEARLSY